MPARSKSAETKRRRRGKSAGPARGPKVGATSQERLLRPLSCGSRRPSDRAAIDLVEDERGRVVLALRARLGLNRETFARLIPVSTRTLATIEAGQTPGEIALRKLTEIERLVEALSEMIRGEAIGPWLVRPNEAFGGLKPMEVIERGEVDRLWRMAYELGSGMPG